MRDIFVGSAVRAIGSLETPNIHTRNKQPQMGVLVVVVVVVTSSGSNLFTSVVLKLRVGKALSFWIYVFFSRTITALLVPQQQKNCVDPRNCAVFSVCFFCLGSHGAGKGVVRVVSGRRSAVQHL